MPIQGVAAGYGRKQQKIVTLGKMDAGAKKKRTVLNKATAVEIYQHKIRLMVPMSYKASIQSWKANIRGESSKLAKQYGVSSKTIRDVWNRRSWIEATDSLWHLDKDVEGNQVEFSWVSSIEADTSNRRY